ncbi:MAG: SIS domain-containing protein [Actinomycetota bacterium]
MTLWDEIKEQPAALRRMLDHNRAKAADVADRLNDEEPMSVLIAARGTSDNAGRYAQYVWGARNGLNVSLATPSLFTVYGRPPRLDGTFVVGISQSGESPDLVAVLEEAVSQGRPTLAITNHADSPMAQIADHSIELHAGEEKAIAATKTYTTQLAAIALLSSALAGEDDPLDAAVKDTQWVLDQAEDIARYAQGFADIDRAAVLGRGFNFSTAFEWALKLQELTYILAQPYSTADFMHGPLALVSSGFPVLAVAPSGSPHAVIHELLARLTADLGSRLAVISDDDGTLALAEAPIRIPAGPEWLSPITSVIAAQVFSYHLAVAKGIDPDAPRTIQKVTRTT